MRQTFDELIGPNQASHALPLVRREMARQGLDVFIVPHEDEYLNEFLPPANERLRWLTGFTGSAGIAVVGHDKAAIFVDGRYTNMCRNQVSAELIEVRNLDREGVADYVAATAKPGMVIGYDSRLHSEGAVAKLAKGADRAGAVLKASATNPLDDAWAPTRPPLSCEPLTIHPADLAGQASREKRLQVGQRLADTGGQAALITALPSVAWLFNIRGGDIARMPVPIAQAIIHADGRGEIFVEPSKVDGAMRDWLGTDVVIRAPGELGSALAGIGNVLIDPHQSSAWHFAVAREAGATVAAGEDPCAMPRACKNEQEVAAARHAHAIDGVALTRFLHWFETVGQQTLPDEIEVVTRLERFREESGMLRDLAFDTIAGAGPNGAIGHYRVTTATNRRVEIGSVLLLDSGGQYLEGTTDVTRTVAIGEPPPKLRRRYTLVLKAHLALANARFPAGTPGIALDAIARQPLWAAGTDYAHGTGHGVGAYLGVHEGPQRIAKTSSMVPLTTGMIVSNEPGNYRRGEFGIRIENLMVVTAAERFGLEEQPMHGFETLTMAPLDRRLIDRDLLTSAERAQVDAYHLQVLAVVGPLVPPGAAPWLANATRSL